ncbi:MAG TPA: EAL domain-containing protein [Sphingomicrobium sp.]|nr:EAL domain-containing protein [Sphingomicrobium sp.]
MQRGRDWSRRPPSLVFGLLVTLAACLLSALGTFGAVEDQLTDWRSQLLDREPTGQVAIVEIDARSLARLRSWPWPRGYHAQVVRNLDEAGASIIGFDIDFSARSHDGDEELAAAIRQAGNVILPIFEQKASTREGEPGVIASRPDARFGDAWVGAVNIFADPDGIVREYPAAVHIGGAVQPSIATLLAEKNGMGDRSFHPDWAIDAAKIPRLSFVDVMQGRASAKDLRGKRVLIGATAIELGDRYVVPRFGVLPGVVIQALAAESLLQNRAVQRTAWPVTALGILLIAFLFAARPIRRRLRYAALCGLATTAIIAGPILIQWAWPISIDSAAWLFTIAISIAVQTIVEVRRVLRARSEEDSESGLPNRSALENELTSLADQRLVLAAAAIERFETIRDGAGIASTNEMIRKAATIIAEAIDGPVFRIAPDVLAWVQAPIGEGQIEALLAGIQARFRHPVQTLAGPVDVTLTVGLDRSDATEAPVLRVERALSAIRAARSSGKPCAWYDGADPQLRRQLSMMSGLWQAMDKGDVRLAYQPKMALATGRISDAEALVRWQDQSLGAIAPDEFIPLAEETGMIGEVTSFALRVAAQDLALWTKAGHELQVSVNVSALDLASPDFAGEALQILEGAGVRPSRLTLEITERALIRSPAEAIATLETLRARGIRLSVDDYGTGQSTLSYLKHLPVQELKIDRSFITSLAASDSDSIMVRSTIALAHELGLEVVAEGIEDDATLEVLRQLGCDYVQGYFIGRPVGRDEFLAMASRPKTRRVA